MKTILWICWLSLFFQIGCAIVLKVNTFDEYTRAIAIASMLWNVLCIKMSYTIYYSQKGK